MVPLAPPESESLPSPPERLSVLKLPSSESLPEPPRMESPLVADEPSTVMPKVSAERSTLTLVVPSLMVSILTTWSISVPSVPVVSVKVLKPPVLEGALAFRRVPAVVT